MEDKHQQKASIAWHSILTDSVLKDLTASATGLSQNEAAARLKKYGANRLPEAARRSNLMRFLLQFHNILIYVLIGCAVVTAALDHWIDTGVILRWW